MDEGTSLIQWPLPFTDDFFSSIYVYGAKFSLFNWHQAVGKIEICSCIFSSQMGRLLSTPLLLSLHASYQIIDRRYVVIESHRDIVI